MTAQKMARPRYTPARFSRAKVWDFLVWLFQFSIMVFIVVSMIMGLVNVFGSGVEVEALAQQTACQGQPAGCEAVTLKLERRAFGHTMEIRTTGGTMLVKCQREYIFYSAWGCTAAAK